MSSKKDAEISRLGLRATLDSTGRFYYSDKEEYHYEWTGKKFIKSHNIAQVWDDTYVTNRGRIKNYTK